MKAHKAFIIGTTVAAAMLVAVPAMALDLDFSKVMCKEFVSASKDEIGTILTWLEGYYTKENDPPIMRGN
jgi:HdeA/HdeB family